MMEKMMGQMGKGKMPRSPASEMPAGRAGAAPGATGRRRARTEEANSELC